MEVLLPGLILLLVVLFALVLFVPGLAVVLAAALPVWAIVMLARLLHPHPRHAQPTAAGGARVALAGAHAATGGAGAARVPRSPPFSLSITPLERDGVPKRRDSRTELLALARELRSGEALFAFDRDLTVLSWNEGAAALTGIPAEQALGRHCWELLCGVDADGNLVCHAGCAGAQLASQGSQVKGQRLLIKTATGARRTISLSTVALRGGDEPLTLHMLRDGTEPTEENRQPSASATAGRR